MVAAVVASIVTVLAGLGVAGAAAATVRASTASTTYAYDSVANNAQVHHMGGLGQLPRPAFFP
jgi:hypothetical protein